MKKLLSFIFVIISISSNAQHSFTAWVTSISGSCNTLEDKVTVGIIQSTTAHYSSSNYPSHDICEDMRRDIMEGYSSGSCTVRVATTPCTPSEGSGAADISGPSKGYSFYSSNPADEVYNWSNDDIERHLAFNKNYQSNMPEAITTLDNAYNKERAIVRENSSWYLDMNKPFVSVNMREGGFSKTDSDDFSIRKKFDKATDYSFLANSVNVQRYVKASKSLTGLYLADPQKLTQLLHNEFKTASGFDLDAIMQRLPSERTQAENQALIDYQEYRKVILEQMAKDIEGIIDNTKEKKEIDAAILALDSYGDDKEEYLSQTNYIKLNLESLPDYINTNIIKVAEQINQCNNTETGFHAELYYNKVTDTYVISFRGTEGKDINDIKTDATIGGNVLLDANIEIKQYELALQIAKMINNIPQKERDNLKIEVVGHSLGGGLASIVGLATGMDAKTFNAATVPDSFLKEKGLFDKVSNGDVQNITAYHTSTDILTNIQNLGNASAIGISVDIGNPATLTETAKAAGTGIIEGISKGSILGLPAAIEGGALGATVGLMAEGHRMVPIVRSIYNSNSEKKREEWDRLRYLQTNVNKNANHPERQTQDSILIITDD